MVMLKVMPDDAPGTTLLSTKDFDEAVAALAKEGVRLRQWPLRPGTVAEMSVDDVLAAYADEITNIKAAENFSIVDCVKFDPADTDEWRAKAATARQTFLSEHRHTEDEVRFFAGGVGCFYLHLPPNVFAVVCEPGDLLSVPTGTTHWFDMGPVPTLCAIRFFERSDGWIGDFTGSDIAERFPDLPELLAGFGQ